MRTFFRLILEVWGAYNRREYLWLALAAGLSAGIMFGATAVAGLRPELRWAGVLTIRAWPLALAILTLGFFVSTALGALLVGWIEFESSLFAAAVGWAAIAAKSGTTGMIVRSLGSPNAYWLMLLETIVLFAIIAAAWYGLLRFGKRRPRDPAPSAVDHVRHQPYAWILAPLTQAAVTTLLVAVLAQSDVRKQAAWAVLIATTFGNVAAYANFPIRSGIWLLIGPMLPAVIGYVWAGIFPGQWEIGAAPNTLANVSPLTYASFGVAAAMYTYGGARRRWHEPSHTPVMPPESRAPAAKATTPPPPIRRDTRATTAR